MRKHLSTGFSAMMLVATFSMFGNAFAQTGKCHSARDSVKAKTWEAIRYTYSPQYIEDNKSEFEKTINGGTETFFKNCQSVTLSDEQIILQGVLDLSVLPIQKVASTIVSNLGLPPLGEKALHISVKAIDDHGIFGGPNSFFRKPFG